MAETVETKEPRPLISGVRIENFRSIPSAEVELGRVTVVVGANGSGKSNLLEAIAVAGAAAADKLDHEFLAARGIRPIEHALVVPRFACDDTPEQARIAVGAPLSLWEVSVRLQTDPRQSVFVGTNAIGGESAIAQLRAAGDRLAAAVQGGESIEAIRALHEEFMALFISGHPPGMTSFLIYAPEYTALRTFTDEGQILPLGVRGEGLFKHLVDLSRKSPEIVERIGEHLKVLDWFDGFVIPSDLGPGEKRLAIRDRYLAKDVLLDQRAANEGFLFLLFVYTLLLSPDTPRFFAIDNADASLNPLLCARVVADIVELAREKDKQVILTTHNPALLDGLDLSDEEQRLLVCERDLDGHTQFRRVPKPRDGTVRLSEAFLRGYLGGLPKSF
ncbi:MAG: AAA family ATPase [Pseudomonadota bacterium]|nr:AAA family ATPase [Pseudomonadota bacterium]